MRDNRTTPRVTALILCLVATLLFVEVSRAVGAMSSSLARGGMVEWTIMSHKSYVDPFNDVDVDVVFNRGDESWRVPTFWRGGQRWTVRFAPPVPGVYQYHLESTDKSNPDLNGHEGRVTVRAYSGKSLVFRQGPVQVSVNKRYFEHADGTPFFWLGDTWWTGLSSRLPWEGFKTLTADRKKKGFTVVQIVAGLVPPEETCPVDPGCQNEGGPVWTPGFKRINPKYFDFADRRVLHLIDSDIVPAIVGAWSNALGKMGVQKLEKHWRYIIARYGAYPVFWIVGGELFDPPEEVARKLGKIAEMAGIGEHLGEWTDIARYVRATDPYHHPVTAHEWGTDDPPLQEESLTDFRLFQPGHAGWPSIAIEVAQLDLYFSRTQVTKPLVVGEIGYEMLGRTHLEDFQRVAFWLAMLNGAAGRTYGAAGIWESYTSDRPLHRFKLSFLTWDEGMNLPGSYEIGLGAKLLQKYQWCKFQPHPEWVTPRGTTLLEPRGGVNEFHVDLMSEGGDLSMFGLDLPVSEWKRHNGNFLLPYAAGIPGETRVIYIPYFGLSPPDSVAGAHPPTILALEPGVRYHAYYWEPSLGITVDLGMVQNPGTGATFFKDDFTGISRQEAWTDYHAPAARGRGQFSGGPHLISVVKSVHESNVIASVDAQGDADVQLILRYQDVDNYVSARYSPLEKTINIVERKGGITGQPLGLTSVSVTGTAAHFTAELRNGVGIAAIVSDGRTTTTPIVDVTNTTAGRAGVACDCESRTQTFRNFELYHVPELVSVEHLERKLFDAAGRYRGELKGPTGLDGVPGYKGWSDWGDYGKEKHLLLDAYRPEELPPGAGDWVLVLDSDKRGPH